MGIQDRDYYRERHRHAASSKQKPSIIRSKSPNKFASYLKQVLIWLAINGVVYLAINHYLATRHHIDPQPLHVIQPVYSAPRPVDATPEQVDRLRQSTPVESTQHIFKCRSSAGNQYSDHTCGVGSESVVYNAQPSNNQQFSITLARDDSGRYIVPGNINGNRINMVVDTGATNTSISGQLAYSLGIRNCKADGISGSANGKTSFCRIKVSNLTVAGMSFNDVTVSMLPNMTDTALLGMDILSHMRVSQNQGLMTITK